MKLILTTAVLGFVLTQSAAAQCVEWTPGFNAPGILGNVHGSVVFDDGTGNGPELFVGGRFHAAGDVAANNIAKWNGTRWAALGDGRPSAVNSFLVWDDGSGPALFVGCDDFSSAPAGGTISSIAKWNGTTWTELPGGVWVGHVGTMVPFDDGSGPALFVGGTFRDINGPLPLPQTLARFDGSGWSQVGSGLTGPSESSAGVIVPDHAGVPQLFALGHSLRPDASTPAAPVWRWDGTTWNNASAGWYPQAYPGAMTVVHSSSGTATLYAAGSSTIALNQQKLMLWTGSNWLAVGPNLGGHVSMLKEVPQPGGDALLYAGGPWTTFYPFLSGGLGIWSNFQWSTPAAPLDKNVSTIAFYDEGSGPKLFAGLYWQAIQPPGESPRGVGRLDGATWVTPGTGSPETGYIQGLAVADDGGGEDLYACGVLSSGTGVLAGRVSRLVGHTWQPIGATFDGTPLNMREHDDGVHGRQLYACGYFTSNGGIARFDGAAWQPLGSGMQGILGPAGVNDMITFDDGSGERLIAFGRFELAGGMPAESIARWDGAQWSPMGAGFDAQPELDGAVTAAVVHDDGNGPALYVGGSFTESGGLYVPYVARWNGSTWTKLGTGPGAAVTALHVHDHGQGERLYAGVESGFALRYWNGTAWQAVPGGPSSVHALASFDDGTGHGPRLYVNGLFSSGYGASFDGTTWEPLGAGLTSAQGAAAVAASAMAVFDDGFGPALFVGGAFSQAGPYGSVNIARLGPTGACTPTTGTAFCFGDGSGTACPCGNAGASQHGCASSVNALGATLAAEGQAHLASDNVTLRAADLPLTTTLLFFQGTDPLAGGSGVAFGDGLRCVGGTVVRLATRQASAGTASLGHAVLGDPQISEAGHLPGTWTTRNYQAWYRNLQPFCTPSTFNLTSAVSIRWAP